MSKKKKIIITFIVIFLILLILIFASLLFKEKIIIDMESLNNTIIEKGEFNFSNMKDIDMEYINSVLGIDSEYVLEYIGKVPVVEVTSSMYVVIHTRSKKEVDTILQKLETFAKTYENEWSNFLLSEHKFVENRKIGKKGNYVYLIISENSEELEKII